MYKRSLMLVPAAQQLLPIDSSGKPPGQGLSFGYAPGSPYCVLVIDQSPTVCRIVKACLESHHMLVFDFADAVQALQWLEESTSKLHIVLLDIDGPFDQWFLVTHHVRSQATYGSPAIIALSRKVTLPDHIQEVQTGIRQCLVKPFLPQELLHVVQSNLPSIAGIWDDLL